MTLEEFDNLWHESGDTIMVTPNVYREIATDPVLSLRVLYYSDGTAFHSGKQILKIDDTILEVQPH